MAGQMLYVKKIGFSKDNEYYTPKNVVKFIDIEEIKGKENK